jgi:hypothetical protein
MKNIHVGVENSRGFKIPNWAYQDVLYMLIANTMSAFELLHRPLTTEEKKEIYEVFYKVGLGMGIIDLPDNIENWEIRRNENLSSNYHLSGFSLQLFDAYKTHLGSCRFQILLYVQQLLLDAQLKGYLSNFKVKNLCILLKLYKTSKSFWPINQLKYYLLPGQYGSLLRKFNTTL